MARTHSKAGTGSAPERKSRSGTETRQRSAVVGLRLLPEQRLALEEEARRRGLSSAQELILLQLQPVFAGAAFAAAS